MNILFYVNNNLDFDKLGGIETLNLYIAKNLANLAKKKHNIFLASDCKKKKIKDNLFYLPIKSLYQKTHNYHFDVIIGSNDTSFYKKYKKSKKILWLHNVLQIEKSIRKKNFFSINYYRPYVVFVSEYLKNKNINFFLFKKKFVISNLLSDDFKLSNKSFKRKKIFVWSVQRDKGLDETISTWISNIFPMYKSAKLYIFVINKSIYSSKLKFLNFKKYFFFGRVSKKKLKNIYLKSTAMICLGYDETFCLNALEANSCGLPIITFAKTALRDYSIDNYNSLIAKNFNDLSKKFIFNLIKKKIWINIIKFNPTCQKFDPSLITKKWLKMIESL